MDTDAVTGNATAKYAKLIEDATNIETNAVVVDTEPLEPEPVINIPAPVALQNTHTGGLTLGLGVGALSTGLGIVIIVFNHDKAVETIIGSIFTAGGPALAAATIRWYRKARKNAILANLQQQVLHDNFLEHAPQAIKQQRKLPWHIPVSNEFIAEIDKAVITKDKNLTLSLMQLYSEPHLPTPTDVLRHAKKKQEALITFLMSINRIMGRTKKLPTDIRYKLLAHMPELICNYELFLKTIPHAIQSGLLKETIVHCPLDWFNTYYQNKCKDDHKASFAQQVARAATQVRLDNILPLIPESAKLLSEQDIKNTWIISYNNLHAKITQLPLKDAV